MYASRNLRLCTKDCMCLYVCPTGATDTETGQVDFEKCIGCGACVKSCPTGALSLIPEKYPRQQHHAEETCDSLLELTRSKAIQESITRDMKDKVEDPVLKQIMTALELSNRLMNEDLIREAGYMLPQSGNVRRLLEDMLNSDDPSFPQTTVYNLLKRLNFNE